MGEESASFMAGEKASARSGDIGKQQNGPSGRYWRVSFDIASAAQRTTTGLQLVPAPHPEDRLGNTLRAVFRHDACMPPEFDTLLAQLDIVDRGIV